MMNKTVVTSLIFLFISLSNAALSAQQGTPSENSPDFEEDIIGGIGGTGVRSMNRPEILERPEQLERPELLESREAMEDFELDSATDAGMDAAEIPEKPEMPPR